MINVELEHTSIDAMAEVDILISYINFPLFFTAAVKTETVDKTVDPIKKQEELFQAMQAQYDVARVATHTMRGVGLGFQRGQF